MKGKKVLVVGGRSGIGLAVAKEAQKAGAQIIVASRSAEKQKNRLKKILAGCECYALDVTQSEEIVSLFKTIGKIDHLVITMKSKVEMAPFTKLAIENVQSAFDAKFWGQYRLTKIAALYIKKGGSMTFSSGITSQRPYPGLSTMSIINGATESFCKALALELAPIRINAVSPGFAETDNVKINAMKMHFPLKKLGTTSSIAHSYIFLMQDNYITGTVLISDGGATLV